MKYPETMKTEVRIASKEPRNTHLAIFHANKYHPPYFGLFGPKNITFQYSDPEILDLHPCMCMYWVSPLGVFSVLFIDRCHIAQVILF